MRREYIQIQAMNQLGAFHFVILSEAKDLVGPTDEILRSLRSLRMTYVVKVMHHEAVAFLSLFLYIHETFQTGTRS
jgi:hypothetical protein